MLLAELGFRLKSVFSLSQGSPYISLRWNSATFQCSTNINSTAAQLFPGELMVWSVYESTIWKELHTRLNLSYLRRNNLTLRGENGITHTMLCVCSSLVSSFYQQQTMPHSLRCSDGCLTSSNGNLKCTLEENKTVQIGYQEGNCPTWILCAWSISSHYQGNSDGPVLFATSLLVSTPAEAQALCFGVLAVHNCPMCHWYNTAWRHFMWKA